MPAVFPEPLLGDRSRAAVLRAATRVLVRTPQASLAEVATALGIGRTTLHRLFPTRRDLLAAIAHRSIDDLEGVYREAGLASVSQSRDALVALRRLVTALVPRGPDLAFLLRTPELDDDAELAERVEVLDRPLLGTVRVLIANGALAPTTADWWAVQTLLALVYVAWEQVESGRLAPLDADDLVLDTWLRGLGASAG